MKRSRPLSLAVMALTMHDKQILVYGRERFRQPISVLRNDRERKHLFMFLKLNSVGQVLSCCIVEYIVSNNKEKYLVLHIHNKTRIFTKGVLKYQTFKDSHSFRQKLNLNPMCVTYQTYILGSMCLTKTRLWFNKISRPSRHASGCLIVSVLKKLTIL